MRDVVLSVAEEHKGRAADFCRKHRHDNFVMSEVMDDLADEFEKVARAARARALADAAEWVETVGTHTADRMQASVAFHCVNVIRTRAGDRP